MNRPKNVSASPGQSVMVPTDYRLERFLGHLRGFSRPFDVPLLPAPERIRRP